MTKDSSDEAVKESVADPGYVVSEGRRVSIVARKYESKVKL
jgi:hypothetical protein